MTRGLILCWLWALGVTCAAAGSLQLTKWGRCPDHGAVENLDLFQYSSTWYEQGWKDTSIAGPYGHCAFQNLTYINSSVAAVLIQGVDKRTNESFSQYGMLSRKEASSRDGHLLLFLDKKLEVSSSEKSYYSVLATGYASNHVNYAVVYNCRNVGILWHDSAVWVFSNKRFMGSYEWRKFQSGVFKALTNYSIDPFSVDFSEQAYC